MTEQQMPTSEVLNKAADLIESRGWTHGGGWFGETGPLCIEGAIQAAMGATAGPGFHCPAFDAVRSHLGVRALWCWNDLPGRTASEVIEVLRAAALVEQAREDAALLAEVGAP